VLELAGKPESLKASVPDRSGRSTSDWHASNNAWWEPLKDRAPMVETAWS
jgi:hypothetical protein